MANQTVTIPALNAISSSFDFPINESDGWIEVTGLNGTTLTLEVKIGAEWTALESWPAVGHKRITSRNVAGARARLVSNAPQTEDRSLAVKFGGEASGLVMASGVVGVDPSVSVVQLPYWDPGAGNMAWLSASIGRSIRFDASGSPVIDTTSVIVDGKLRIGGETDYSEFDADGKITYSDGTGPLTPTLPENCLFTVDGYLRIGGETNYTEFAPNGRITHAGDAADWEDSIVAPYSARPGVIGPDWEGGFRGDPNSFAYFFDGTTRAEEIQYEWQMPHARLEGTEVFPHVHFTPSNTAPGDVNFKFAVRIANVGEKFPAAETVYEVTKDWLLNNDWTHLIAANVTGFSMTDKTRSCIIKARMYRDYVVDTYQADVAVIGVDLHYQRGRNGTDAQY